ncbi:MAG: FecR family protein [Arenicellales bacterium]
MMSRKLIILKPMQKSLQILVCFCLLGIFPTLSHAQTVVGKVSLLKGVVTAQSVDQALRTLAKGSEILLSDELETSQDSFVVIKMSDGGKITLRPNTILQVLAYSEKPGAEEEKMKLVKGGLRAITGAIGHARPEAVKFEARTTTIGIRGTDFVIYDCIECELLEKSLGDKARIPPGRKDKAGTAYPVITVIEGATRRVLEREEVAEIKNAVYFAVLDGKIFAQSGDERIDLDAIDACYRAGETPLDPDQEFHCLIEIPKFVLFDTYLNVPNDEFTLFNVFRELNDEAELCEVNWK